MQINGALSNSLRIKAAPVNVSAITSGALRLGGL
jgi:hypothetical protein